MQNSASIQPSTDLQNLGCHSNRYPRTRGPNNQRRAPVGQAAGRDGRHVEFLEQQLLKGDVLSPDLGPVTLP